MDFLIISIVGKVTKPCEAYGNHGFLGFVMFTGTQDLVQYGPACQKNIATQSKANILATLKATMTTVVKARGTCEHSENTWLERSYALVGSGAMSKEVVSKNIIA